MPYTTACGLLKQPDKQEAAKSQSPFSIIYEVAAAVKNENMTSAVPIGALLNTLRIARYRIEGRWRATRAVSGCRDEEEAREGFPHPIEESRFILAQSDKLRGLGQSPNRVNIRL